MNRLAPLIAVATVVLAVPAFSQDTSLGESCDLAALGAKDTQAFLAFDKELRAVVAKQDAVAMALLVDHPLRVGDRAGFDYYLDDPGSFQNRYQQIFTPAVRDTILKQPVEKLFCNWTGVMYGSTGVVWVHPLGNHFVIGTVNLNSILPFPKGKPPGAIKFICETDSERIVIDTGANGEPRYRAWNKPRLLTERADLTIASGEEKSDGSGTCAYPIWTFTNDKTKFVAMGVGCFPDVPQGARGTIGLSLDDGPSAEKWCF